VHREGDGQQVKTFDVMQQQLAALPLTLSLLMSCIYMELLVKPETLTSYIQGDSYGTRPK
jgi:hypothetical protein